MTALKVLVTTPKMWHSVQAHVGSLVDYDTKSEERRLAFRVPPNVDTLVFGLSETERVIFVTACAVSVGGCDQLLYCYLLSCCDVCVQELQAPG
jgi:hypothetical protein